MLHKNNIQNTFKYKLESYLWIFIDYRHYVEFVEKFFSNFRIY